MTHITQEVLNEFRQLWDQDHPNEQISDEKLLEIAQRVLCAVKNIYQPIEKTKVENHLKKI